MKLLFSTVWGIAFWLVSALASETYAENYYNARVAKGGDPAFGDIGFTWLVATIGIGLLAFVLGLLGILPTTRRK
jgi:cellobiose phosphorylase